VDALAEFFEFPGDGREDVLAIGEGTGDVAEAEKAAETGFGEAAGVGIGLVELSANFSG